MIGNNGNKNELTYIGASLASQTVKRLPTMQDIWVLPLRREDPLEKEMAAHSSTLAWRIPRTKEPGRLQSMGMQSRTQLSDFTSVHSTSTEHL